MVESSKTYRVVVTQEVLVTIDQSKFDEAFMSEFRSYMFDTFDEIEDHARHLAQLHARGIADDNDFIEGYGPAKEMGIKFRVVGGDEEIVGG